jgi:hypothetical protein
VSCINVNPHGVSTSAGVDGCRYTSQGFSQNDVCATVQNPNDLTIAVNRHARYRALGGNLE